MAENIYEITLEEAGMRPSPVRLLVLKTLHGASSPLTSQEIETLLETVDRSSINRTLSLFAERGLLHTVDDGSGVVKYEPCRSAGCHESHDDRHPHFHCTSCGKTFCFSNLAIPPIPLPDGFSAVSANYVVKGLCPSCSGSNGH